LITLRKLKPNDPVYSNAIETLANDMANWLAIFDSRPFPDAVHKPFLEKYHSDDVKEALKHETGSKCAYCEWKYAAGSWGDVEHIMPKSNDWKHRLLDYANLTIACSICNVSKSNYESKQKPLLNPYKQKPEKHLTSWGPKLYPRDGSELGRWAILKLKLNRKELIAARAEAQLPCEQLLQQYWDTDDPDFKDAFLEEIKKAQAADQEFALIKRGFFANQLPGIARPHRNEM